MKEEVKTAKGLRRGKYGVGLGSNWKGGGDVRTQPESRNKKTQVERRKDTVQPKKVV